MKSILKTILFIFLLFINVFPQFSNENIAEINGLSITKEEFIKRLELSPQLSASFNPDSIKYNLLYTLIAEKLWSLEAKELSVNLSEKLNYFIKYIENLIIRDHLYKIEISDKIILTDNEINDALNKAKTKISVNIYSFDNEDKAKQFSLEFSPQTKDSLINIFRDYLNIETKAYMFGDSDLKLENLIFSLNKNEISDIYYFQNKWMLFEVIEKTINKIIISKQDKEYRDIIKIIEERQKKLLYENFQTKFFAELKLDYNSNFLKKLAGYFSDLIKDKQYESEESIVISEYEIDEISRHFINSKNNPVIEYKDFIITEKDFFNLLSIELITAKKNTNFEKLLQFRLKEYTKKELLADEGRKRGYENLDQVLKEVKMWKDNYLARIFRNSFSKSIKVEKADLVNAYNKYENEIIHELKYKIIEIYRNNLEDFEWILRDISRISSDSLINYSLKYTQRQHKRFINQFITELDNTFLWELANQIESDEVYGPFPIDEGYSLIKVISSSSINLEDVKKFEKSEKEINQLAFNMKLSKELSKKTAELFDNSDVRINHNLIKRISFNPIPMIVYRYFGFGGKYLAVPVIESFPNWINEIKNKELVLP